MSDRVRAKLLARVDYLLECLPPCCGFAGFTYAVRDASGLTKIGASGNLHDRMYDLQAANGSTLELLGISRDRLVEQMLHDRHDSARRHGEWFDLDSIPITITTHVDGTRRCMACDEAAWLKREWRVLVGLRRGDHRVTPVSQDQARSTLLLPTSASSRDDRDEG